ncbi:MAG: hypothetical protein H6628_19225 [Calditrichae bacterium]|nr:hypothetical protein [Calditrichia bacterium]
MKKQLNYRQLLALVLTLAMLLLMGCNKDSMDPVADEPATLTASDDAAESLASNISEDTGGLTDQMADLLSLASNSGFAKLGQEGDAEAISREYDPITGTWTILIERERSNPAGTHSASIYREYNLQFLNAEGEPQQFWLTNGDTARTIQFDIVEGSGEHHTPRISHYLTGLSGSFTATNVNTDLITINGTYFRSGVDTLTTNNLQRTMDHSLDLTVTDLTGPRGIRPRNLSEALSGTISGTYHAFITWTRGEAYRETEINRTFTIVIGDGNTEIDLDGKRYSCNLQTGDINP